MTEPLLSSSLSVEEQPSLSTSKRLVIKIGSALVVDDREGLVRRDWLDALADDVAMVRSRGIEVVLVSSGAIACGRRHLGLTGHTLALEEKQAAAATGQMFLAHAYREALERHGLTVAQVLVTLGDTEERRRHLNARATIDTLLRLGAVPVVNENDTVATAEIRFGDNDRLAARVAQMVLADTLVLLSDVDGLYTGDPRKDLKADHIPVVRGLTAEVEAMGGDAPDGFSTGGMITKLQAAKVAEAGGCRMVIAKGTEANPLAALMAGARCTWFLPQSEPLTARKRWIAGSLQPVGAYTVDDGAAKALLKGRSLLPAGVKAVQGRFERGDPVKVVDLKGRQLAVGLSGYGSDAAREIAGHKTGEIVQRLGYRGRDEIIHRDDLVLLDKGGWPAEDEI